MHRSLLLSTAALATLPLTLVACGDDGTSSPVDAAPTIDAPPGATREVIGSIEVYEQDSIYVEPGMSPEHNPWSNVRAAFYDGRPPRWHREVARAGACVLRRYTPSLCEPACTTGLCVETNVCEPFPSLVPAGRLIVDGLKVVFRISGNDGFYYPEQQLPVELFADDATVRAEIIGGGTIPGFTLSTRAVPPITGALAAGKLTLNPGQDATVTWTPVGGDARMRLTLNSNNRGHGQPYLGILECDVADAAGSITVPAALIDQFPETQAWRICAGTDCPPSTLRRYHRATTPLEDFDLELVVATELAFGVDHILPD